MSLKPAIALFASSLQMRNPRGAGRMFRALAEELARHDEFDSLVLEQRSPASPGTAFRCRPLPEWLAAHPVEIRNDRLGWSPRRWRRSTISCVPRLAAGASRLQEWGIRDLLDDVLHPQVVRRLRQGYRQVQRRLAARRPGAAATFSDNLHRPARVIGLEDVDVLLNFWWLHCAENPLLSCAQTARTRVISWFLDASILRVGHLDGEQAVSPEDFRARLVPHLALSDHVVAISEHARGDLLRYFNVPAERTSVVPCGAKPPPSTPVSPEAARQLFSRLGVEPGTPIVLCIGVDDGWKNVLNVLRACRLLMMATEASAHRFQLVFVGDVSRAGYVEQYAHLSRPLSRMMPVVFAGYLPDHELDVLRQTSAVLLYPSLWEGFGMPPIEAMNCGVPVVVSDTGPLPELCGPHAFYCDPFDPHSIADALRPALALKGAALAEYRACAARHAKGFSWEAAGNTLAERIRRELAPRERATWSGLRPAA